jgi:hypothetical protein
MGGGFSCCFWDVFDPPTRLAPSQSELFGLFCQPVQFDGQLADLGVEPGAFAVEISGIGVAGACAENAGRSLSHGLFPIGYLHRVDVKFLGDLLDGFDSLERFKRYAGFEPEIRSRALDSRR